MCVECNQTPCNNRCPNYEDEIIGFCNYCGNEIFESEQYFENENLFCSKECILYFYDIKENI